MRVKERRRQGDLARDGVVELRGEPEIRGQLRLVRTARTRDEGVDLLGGRPSQAPVGGKLLEAELARQKLRPDDRKRRDHSIGVALARTRRVVHRQLAPPRIERGIGQRDLIRHELVDGAVRPASEHDRKRLRANRLLLRLHRVGDQLTVAQLGEFDAIGGNAGDRDLAVVHRGERDNPPHALDVALELPDHAAVTRQEHADGLVALGNVDANDRAGELRRSDHEIGHAESLHDGGRDENVVARHLGEDAAGILLPHRARVPERLEVPHRPEVGQVAGLLQGGQQADDSHDGRGERNVIEWPAGRHRCPMASVAVDCRPACLKKLLRCRRNPRGECDRLPRSAHRSPGHAAFARSAGWTEREPIARRFHALIMAITIDRSASSFSEN
jgi:hypothetical protein